MGSAHNVRVVLATSCTGTVSRMADKDDPAALTYEQAKSRLDEVVAALEDKALPLDDMVSLWEEGERLAHVCQDKLTAARARLDAVRPVENP